jgi:hypothetical protein
MDFHLCNDSDIDAERCRVSLQRRSPVTIFARDSRGRIACFTGIVHSMHFDQGRATGQRWRVVMHEAKDAQATPSLSPSIEGDPVMEQKPAKP